MIPYLLHSAILLSVFWLFYWLLIRKETYYKLNRYFLVSVIALSLLLPLITIPASLSFQTRSTVASILVNDFYNEEAPIQSTQKDQIISGDLPKSSIPSSTSNTKGFFISNWNLEKGLWLTYAIGVLIFLITFLIQFFILLYRKSKLEYVQDDQYRIYELTDDQAPFSFMKWIFINPAKYDYDTYEQILEHEKVHVSQYHFLDKFLAEFLVIVFWFNPFAWLYRKSITNNIEFLTDYEMLGKGVEKETYQYSLLKVSVPQYALNLTTSYNESFLKERIIMMNTKQSSARSSWKYLLTLPLAFFCMSTLNAVNYSENIPKEELIVNLNSKSKSDDIDSDNELIKRNQEEGNIELSKISSNQDSNSSVNIKEEFKEEKMESISEPKQQKVIDPVSKTSISINNANWMEEGKPGFWRASIEGNKICIALNFMSSRNYHQNQCFSRSEFTNISEDSEGEFVLKRDAGRLILRGEFEDGLGEGRFEFESDPAFIGFLDAQGFKGAKENEILQLFMSDIDKAFVSNAKDDLKDISLSKLVELGIHTNGHSDLEELMEICAIVNHEKLTARELINLAIHNVTLDFVKGLMQVTSEDLTLKRVVEAKIHNVDPELVLSLKQNGYPNISLKRVIEMSIHGVDQNDIVALSEAGYQNVDPKYLTEFAIHGVTSDFIKELADLGYSNFEPRQLIEFAIHGVRPSYIKELEEAGYEDLTARDLVNTKIHGVSPYDAEKYKELGLDISLNKLIEFKIHGVSPSYVEELHRIGFKDLSAGKIVEGKIHGVSPERIKEFQNLNVGGLTWNKVLEAKIHGVSPNFIKKARDAGYNPKDLSEYTHLKIMGIK